MSRIHPTILPPPDLSEAPGNLRYLVLYGSHAHGTATPMSDEDWRGVYQLPTPRVLDIDPPTTTWERKADDTVLWEIGHFCRLLLKGNPNIVGMLWAPDDCVAVIEHPVLQLRSGRQRFITRAMVAAYTGWVKRELREGEALNAKRASHLLRLLWELEGAVVDGEIPVRPDEAHLAAIMQVKSGVTPIAATLRLVSEEMRRIDGIIAKATLPDPPRDYVRQILIEARWQDWIGT